MKKFPLLAVLFFISSITIAQNLVINPSFDVFITCPGFGQYGSNYIANWDKPTVGSSDYYNFNCPGIQPTVQSPRTGEGYSGIIGYNYGTEYREYITGTFNSPLVAGTIYDVEFYVSLNNGYIQAIEELGAYISTTAPGFFTNALHINVIPQVENISGALNDTVNWKRVNGPYLATGGELYITIGNFHDDTTTTITQPGTSGSFGAYYFIDDVSVIADSTTSLQQLEATVQPNVYYSNGLLEIRYPVGSQEYAERLTAYDLTGRKVLEVPDPGEQVMMNGIRKGAYLICLESTEKEFFFKKIIIY